MDLPPTPPLTVRTMILYAARATSEWLAGGLDSNDHKFPVSLCHGRTVGPPGMIWRYMLQHEFFLPLTGWMADPLR